MKTASRAKAETPGPSLRPGRNRDGVIRGVAVGALLVVVAVAVFLIVTSGDDDENGAVISAETTTATETAPEQPTVTEAAPAAPAPAQQQTRQVENCQPILGNGAPFPVTSSARGGTAPASCTEARSVLLTALNQQATTVEDWRCVIDLTAQAVGVCKSGGRTIQAASPS